MATVATAPTITSTAITATSMRFGPLLPPLEPLVWAPAVVGDPATIDGMPVGDPATIDGMPVGCKVIDGMLVGCEVIDGIDGMLVGCEVIGRVGTAVVGGGTPQFGLYSDDQM
jgi:hypothetical protein